MSDHSPIQQELQQIRSLNETLAGTLSALTDISSQVAQASTNLSNSNSLAATYNEIYKENQVLTQNLKTMNSEGQLSTNLSEPEIDQQISLLKKRLASLQGQIQQLDNV